MRDILETIVIVGGADAKACSSFMFYFFTSLRDRIFGLSLGNDFLGLEVFFVVSDAKVLDLERLLELFLVKLGDHKSIMLMGKFMIVKHFRLVQWSHLLFYLEVISGVPKLL